MKVAKSGRIDVSEQKSIFEAGSRLGRVASSDGQSRRINNFVNARTKIQRLKNEFNLMNELGLFLTENKASRWPLVAHRVEKMSDYAD